MKFHKSPRVLSTNPSEQNTPLSFLKSQYSGKMKLHQIASEFEDPARVSDFLNSSKYKLFKEHLNMRMFDKNGRPKLIKNFSKDDIKSPILDKRRETDPSTPAMTRYLEFHRSANKLSKKKQMNVSIIDLNKRIYSLEEENSKLKFEMEQTSLEISSNAKIIDQLNQKLKMLKSEKKEIMKKLDQKSYDLVQLKEFEENFLFYRKNYPEIPLPNFILNYRRMEKTSLELLEKLNSLEESNSNLKKCSNEKNKQLQSLETEINKRSFEQSKRNEIFMKEISQLSSLETNENYKSRYLELSNRITTIFGKWSAIIPVYSGVGDENYENPLKILELLEKILLVRSPSHMEELLRRIIVSAALLGKKALGKEYGNSIDPEEIYEKATKRLVDLKAEVKELNSKIEFLKGPKGGFKP